MTKKPVLDTTAGTKFVRYALLAQKSFRTSNAAKDVIYSIAQLKYIVKLNGTILILSTEG